MCENSIMMQHLCIYTRQMCVRVIDATAGGSKVYYCTIDVQSVIFVPNEDISHLHTERFTFKPAHCGSQVLPCMMSVE